MEKFDHLYLESVLPKDEDSAEKYYLDLEVKIFAKNKADALKQARAIKNKTPNSAIKKIVRSFGGHEEEVLEDYI